MRVFQLSDQEVALPELRANRPAGLGVAVDGKHPAQLLPAAASASEDRLRAAAGLDRGKEVGPAITALATGAM